jgi:histone-lysine N-methyltransferase SUV420H
MRHFAIYAQPWPSRAPRNLAAASLPTPRESTPVEGLTKRVTDKGLSTLDRKLAAAASSKLASRINCSKINLSQLQDPALKWRKSEPTPRVQTPDVAKQAPSVRPVPTTGAPDSEPPKRKRGRPRLSSPRRVVRSSNDDKGPVGLKSLAVKNQPRDSNGRFGKKGNYLGRLARQRFLSAHGSVPLSRAERAMERNRVKHWLERKAEKDGDEDSSESSSIFSRKRDAIDLDDLDRPCKRARNHDGDESSFRTHPMFSGVRKSPPGFKSMGLLRTPNPMTFARRTWGEFGSQTSDATTTSEDETDLPVTPEDVFSLTVVDDSNSDSIHDDENDCFDTVSSPGSTRRPPTVPTSLGALTFSPSPVYFAKRRWGSWSPYPEQKSQPCKKDFAKGRSPLPELGRIDAGVGKVRCMEPSRRSLNDARDGCPSAGEEVRVLLFFLILLSGH